MYQFGKELAPLASIDHNSAMKQWWFTLWNARNRLEAVCGAETPLLSSSLRAGRSLINAITGVVPEAITDIDMSDGNELGWRASGITTALQQLESVLQNEMPDVASYVVSQKGIFRTEDLIQKAEHQLSAASRLGLPMLAQFDIQQAGKCLAYELAVACAFHLWRAVETVMATLYERKTGTTLEAAGAMRNWAEYIKLMRKANIDPKITTFLDHIRDQYRNPISHPERKDRN